MFSILDGSSSSGASLSTPPGNVVLSTTEKLLSLSSEAFSLKLFQLPLFRVATLYETAKLYSYHEVNKEYLDDLHLNDRNMKDSIILTLVRFSFVIGYDCKSTSQFSEEHKRSKKISRYTYQQKETARNVSTSLKLSQPTVATQVFLPAQNRRILNFLGEKDTLKVSKSSNAPADLLLHVHSDRQGRIVLLLVLSRTSNFSTITTFERQATYLSISKTRNLAKNVINSLSFI